jgi:hypothetical protein
MESKQVDTKQLLKKIAKIAGNVLLYAFIIISLAGVLLTITAKKDADGTATIFGMQMRFVLSPSMEKSDATDVSDFKIKDIPTKSVFFIEVVPDDPAEAEKWYSELAVGDVLTFKYVYVTQETITHRITSIEPKATGGYIIELEGDNKSENSDTLSQTIDTSLTDSPNYVIGKVVGQNYALGLFVNMLKNPIILILCVIVPAVGIIIFEIIRLVALFGAERRQKDQEEKEKQQSELDELRRKLAALEAANAKAENQEQPVSDDTPKNDSDGESRE